MTKTNKFPVFKRAIVLKLHPQEAINLMEHLDSHRGELKATVKRLQDTQEERGENCMTDIDLCATEDWLESTCSLKSRLLKIYRRWQKRENKKREKSYAQERKEKEKGGATFDDIPF